MRNWVGVPLGLIGLWGAASISAANTKELARVAILTYDDETGTKNFAYMPDSLTEAIDKSLQKRFDYVREEPKKSEEQRRRIKKTGIFTAKEAAQYCARFDVQILVYGRFTYDDKSRQLVVDTWISLGSEKDHRQLKERRNPTDASIFNLADKVAEDIVQEMTQIALEQKKSAQSAATPAPAGQKLELEKKVTPRWLGHNYQLGLSGALLFAISDTRTAFHETALLQIALRKSFFSTQYIGLQLATTSIAGREQSRSAYTSELALVSAQAAFGRYWFFGNDRWRFHADITTGFYYGRFSIQATGNEVFAKDFVNPVLGANAGLHYLIFSSFSVGLNLGYLHLFDKGALPAQFVTFQLELSYVF